MQKLNETALWQLIKGGETSTVELKVASPRPDEMAERLCGLANAQGGFIIIGIADESLDIVGIPDKKIAQTKDVILRATRQIIKPELLLDPSKPEVYVVDGKKLVVATVPPNRGAVYQVSGVFWVRRGTYTVPLTVSEIMELAHDRGLVSWEKQIVREATMKDIDVELVRAYINQRAGGSGAISCQARAGVSAAGSSGSGAGPSERKKSLPEIGDRNNCDCGSERRERDRRSGEKDRTTRSIEDAADGIRRKRAVDSADARRCAVREERISRHAAASGKFCGVSKRGFDSGGTKQIGRNGVLSVG